MGVIAKQGILGSILSYLGIILGVISIIYVQPHFLSTAEIGLTRILVSFSYMACIFIPLGIGSVTTRFFPAIRNTDNQHNGHFMVIFLFCFVGCAILSLMFIIFRQDIIAYYQQKSPLFNEYYHLVFVLPFVLALIIVYNIYCASLHKTVFTVFLNEVLIRLLQIINVLLYYYDFFGLDGFMSAFVGAYVVQLVLLVIYIHRIGRISFQINWSFYRSFFSRDIVIFAFLMIFTAFASIGIKMVDQLIMGHYLSLSAIGIYATSIFMVSVMEVPYNSLERISNAIAAQSWADGNYANLRKVYYDSVRVLMIVGGYLFVGLLCCSHSIFQLLPSEFAEGEPCMLVMALSSFFNLATGVNSTIIATSHKYFVISVFLLILIVTSIVSNIWLIPVFGIVGSAYASFISVGFFNLLKVTYLWYRLKMVPYDRNTLIIIITILMASTIYFLPDLSSPYLTMLMKGSLISLIFLISVIKFKLMEELTSKIHLLKRFIP